MNTAPTAPTSISLWAGVLGAPVAWALQLQIGYALAPALCHAGSRTALYVLSAACVVAAIVGAVLSYREWRFVGGGPPDMTDGGAVARRRFLGALGLIVAVTFVIVMVAQALAGAFFNPCWT